MGPARRWGQSGNLTGRGVQLRAVGTRPCRGGSSRVPLGARGRGDRTWREPGAGRREGSARSGQGHVWPAGTRTSRVPRFPEAAGEVPRRSCVPGAGVPER